METFFVGSRAAGLDRYAALICLLRAPEQAQARFEELFTSRHTADQLYGLLGLFQLNRAAFERRARTFSHSNQRILEHDGGCTPRPTTAQEILARIRSGSYQQRIAWARQAHQEAVEAVDLQEDSLCFCIGEAGVGRVRTAGYRRFLNAFFSEDARENLTVLLASSTPVEQVYGLFGMHLLNPGWCASARKRLEQRHASVPFVASWTLNAARDIVTKTPFFVLLLQVESGFFDDAFFHDIKTFAAIDSLSPDARLFKHYWHAALLRDLVHRRQVFAVGGVGFGGTLLPGYRALLEGLRRRDATEYFLRRFLDLTKQKEIHLSEALYAWLGVHLTDKNSWHHSDALPSELLLEFRGSSGRMTTSAQVRERIDAGDYDRSVRSALKHGR